jgi:hypothetical protein
MESKQPPSRSRSDLETPGPEESERTVNAKVEETNVQDHKHVEPDDPTELEALRQKIHTLTEEISKSSKSQGVSTHPLALLVVGFLLSTIPGGFLTFYYGRLQQELTAQRTFSDEVNKIRVQKVGEVWEKLDEHEFVINRLLEESTFEAQDEDSSSNNKRADEIIKLIHDDQAMASRYRFWLGENLFRKTTEYLDRNIEYAQNKIGARPGTDLSELTKTRNAAKQDILQIRGLFLGGEPGAQPKSADK